MSDGPVLMNWTCRYCGFEPNDLTEDQLSYEKEIERIETEAAARLRATEERLAAAPGAVATEIVNQYLADRERLLRENHELSARLRATEEQLEHSATHQALAALVSENGGLRERLAEVTRERDGFENVLRVSQSIVAQQRDNNENLRNRVALLDGLLKELLAAADSDEGYGDEFVATCDRIRAAIGGG